MEINGSTFSFSNINLFQRRGKKVITFREILYFEQNKLLVWKSLFCFFRETLFEKTAKRSKVFFALFPSSFSYTIYNIVYVEGKNWIVRTLTLFWIWIKVTLSNKERKKNRPAKCYCALTVIASWIRREALISQRYLTSVIKKPFYSVFRRRKERSVSSRIRRRA